MSIYVDHDDPWDNGWGNAESPNTNTNISSSTNLGFSSQLGASSFLSASQLGNTRLTNASPLSNQSIEAVNVPSSYRAVYEGIGSSCSTIGDLETSLFNKLITHGILTVYQKSQILDTVYENNLLPPSREANFFQILGLIALEIEAAGSGDYDTLQFRLLTLPPLAESTIQSISGRGDFGGGYASSIQSIDPLNAQLANTLVTDEGEPLGVNRRRIGGDLIDPILTDHTSIQHKHDGAEPGQRNHIAAAVNGGTNHNNNTKSINNESELSMSFDEIFKYVAEVKETFSAVGGSHLMDIVKIKEVPEKEGILFKHTNYIISHELNLGLQSPSGGKKVIRRYSDFAWLLDYLLKKYPFRIIPGLPPKKFNVGSSPDSQFLQKRRRGLSRFLNQLVKHPVLIQDSLVVTFLSVPTDIATWKKQAKVDYSLEFKGVKIQTQFINDVWPAIGEEFLNNWKQAENNIIRLIEIWTKIVLLVERYEKRQQQISLDNSKFVDMINKFQGLNGVIYPNSSETSASTSGYGNVISLSNKEDMSAINDSLHSILNYFNKSSQALIDESFSISTIILEKFKNFLDYLYLLQELFERLKKLLINNIPQLQNRIQENEKKYAKLLTDDVDIKGSDLAKLRQIIINDKQEIFQQLNKDWLIKECCFREFLMFQETQYLISDLWVDWSKGRFKFQEKMSLLSDTLNKEVLGNMPSR